MIDMHNQQRNWDVRVYDEHDKIIAAWIIENRSEYQADDEATAQIKQHYPDSASWTLTIAEETEPYDHL
jgi:hypothetical protein